MIEETVIKNDFFLVLPDESSMYTILPDFYQNDEEGVPELKQYTNDYWLDVVGTIYDPTGITITSPDGMEYPEIAPVPGWHINIRLIGDNYRQIVEALDVTYGSNPVTPRRVFA